jgi:hypothetical protein
VPPTSAATPRTTRSGSETRNRVARGSDPDRDAAEQSCALEHERGRVRVVRLGHVVGDAAEERASRGLDRPAGRHLDVDAAEQRADRKLGFRCELRVPQVDGDSAEPGEQRTAAKRLRTALQLDPAEDGGERDLVALLVPPRRQHPLHERPARHDPGPEAELQEEHCTD